MEHVTVPGRSYAVTSEQDCTLTAANGWKLELKAGIQQHFTAQFDTFTASAPITLTANFNSAPATSSGGGSATITLDATPTQDSTNPVTSGGVYAELNKKQAKLTFDTTPKSGSTNPVTSGGVYTALAQISTEQKSTAYVLEILGEMYLGDAWWQQEMSMEDGLVVYLQRLPEADGESIFRGRLTLSEPRTASQLLAALTTRTGAASGEFLVYPVSVN